MRTIKIRLSALLLILLSAANLSATQLALDLDTAYLNPTITPVGISPWLVAEFEDLAPNSVQLTMKATGLAAGSTPTQSVGNWLFNATDSLLGLLTFQFASGNQATIFQAPNQRPAGGGLLFDIEFDFAAGIFAAGAQTVYLISSINPLQPVTADSFAFASVFSPTQTGYYSAALVEGANSWIAAASIRTPGPGPGPEPIPEPATMVLLAFGLSGLAVYGRKKFFA